MKKILNFLKVYEWVFVIFCFALVTVLSIINGLYIELIVTIIGLLSAIFNVKQNSYCFIFYALYALTYGVTSLIKGQYGIGLLYLIYNLPVYCIAVYNLFFNKNKKDENQAINILDKKGWIISIMSIPIITAAYGIILYFINSQLPFLNALATAFSLCAAFLSSKRIREQWIFWILFAIASTSIWLISYVTTKEGALLYLVLNALYIVFNLAGLISWYKKGKKDENINN